MLQEIRETWRATSMQCLESLDGEFKLHCAPLERKPVKLFQEPTKRPVSLSHSRPFELIRNDTLE